MARPDKYDVAKKRKSKSLYGNGTIVHEKRPLNLPLLYIAYFPKGFWAVSVISAVMRFHMSNSHQLNMFNQTRFPKK